MEIVAGVMVVTTVCVAAGIITLRGAGAAAQVMTQMFDSPANLGWPSGVQEDDDFHWRWSGHAAPGQDEVGSGGGRVDLGWGLFEDTWNPPEIVDLRDGTGPRPSPVLRR